MGFGKMHRIATCVAAGTAVVSIASVAPAAVVDGSKDAAYGSALAVQTTATQFGDSGSGSASAATGSELDAAYAQISGGKLYLLFTGNLETHNTATNSGSYNHLNIYLDTNSGGVATNSPSTGNSVTFDTGFTADRFIDLNGDQNGQYINFTNLDNNTGSYLGQFGPTGTALSAGDGNGPASFQVAFNNSNTAGVTGDQSTTTTTAAAAVTTGFEVVLSLADLGSDGSNIRVAALINGGGNGYLSNQTLGALPVGTGNLADGAVNLNNFAGSQFFTVSVPEPTTLAALAGSAIVALRRRRRSVAI